MNTQEAAAVTVVQALAAVMADVIAVSKSDRNQQQGFNFRGVDAVVNAVGPALRKHKVIVLPEVRSFDYGTVSVGSKGTQMGHVRLLVAYTFYGPAGDSLTAVVPGESFDSGDKATAKAMSVAFRTALLQSLALPTDEPDPDSQAYERAPAESAGDPRPPSHEELLARAQGASTGRALTVLSHAAVAMHDRRLLTDEQFQEIKDVVIARRAELAEPK